MLRDTAGQKLTVEILTGSERDVQTKSILAIVDYWQRLGVVAEPEIFPPQRATDREMRATYPGFQLAQAPGGSDNLTRFRGLNTPLPANRFAGQNYARYMDPRFNALLDQYFVTIPWQERMRVLGGVVHQLTDQVVAMGLFHDTEISMIGLRLVNASGDRARPTWNAHEWDLK